LPGTGISSSRRSRSLSWCSSPGASPSSSTAWRCRQTATAVYSAAELKTIQEVVTLVVFAAFSVLYLREPLGWNHAIGFTLIAAGAAFVFSGRG